MTADDPAALSRLLAVVAQDLDHRGYGPAGIVRQAARLLAGLGPAQSPDTALCPVCAGAVSQPGRGRPRVYCSQLCRRRARNLREMGG